MTTGGEIVAGGKAAAAIGKAALGENDEERTELAQLAKDSPSMKAAAEAYARRLAVKQTILLRLYRPLARMLGVSKTYFDEQFAIDMADKIADIPEENLTTPKALVAIPAMQGLGYSLDEPNLKEMYLNLLATATDDRRADEAHPSFAEIIKQLSGDEARLLTQIVSAPQSPAAVVQLRVERENEEGWTVALNYLMDLYDLDAGGPVEAPSLPVWIDNWIRLGLIQVDYTSWFTRQERYDWVDQRPEVSRLRETVGPGRALVWQKGILQPTDFGRQFAMAVGASPTVVQAPPTAEEGPNTSEGNAQPLS